jgi:hypothetical protein
MQLSRVFDLQASCTFKVVFKGVVGLASRIKTTVPDLVDKLVNRRGVAGTLP